MQLEKPDLLENIKDAVSKYVVKVMRRDGIVDDFKILSNDNGTFSLSLKIKPPVLTEKDESEINEIINDEMEKYKEYEMRNEP